MSDAFLSLLPTSEHADFHTALQQYPPRCVRLQPEFQNVQLPFATEAVPWYHHGRLLTSPLTRPSQFLEYGAGHYYIQDAGSLLALALLDAKPGELICDLCAAPGGKASGILEQLGEEGFLVANETIQNRVELLRFTLARSGYLNYAATQLDPERFAALWPSTFDAVLVDAPCSGQAMVVSGKRDRNAFDPHQVEHSAQRQERILRAAARILKPGGRLIYSTCTFAVEENEAQIEAMMRRDPNLWEALQPSTLDAWSSPRHPGCYRLWPHRHATSGAFAAGLRLRDQPVDVLGSDLSNANFLRSKSRPRSPHRDAHAIDVFGTTSRMTVSADEHGNVFGVDERGVTSLPGCIPFQAWPMLVKQKGQTWVPQYALCRLRPAWFASRNIHPVDADEAKMFLGGNIIVTGAEYASGQDWVAITWNGNALGWGKFAGNRLNNHMPKLGILNFASVKASD